MKPNIDKPADSVMKFFSRDLYARLQSPREEVVDEAEAGWEEAVAGYEDYLEKVRAEMPSHVRALADTYLHDAEFLALSENVQPVSPPELSPFPSWAATAVLLLKQEGTFRTLVYGLLDRVRTHDAPEDWPLSKRNKHWLCDEVLMNADRHRGFLHRILFSDGEVVEIPFSTFNEVRFSLPDAANGMELSGRTR